MGLDDLSTCTERYSACSTYAVLAYICEVCHLVYTNLLKRDDIKVAQQLFIQFCKQFEKLYGWQRCTPNMHMHTHLDESPVDYGPVHDMLERYNRILIS